MKRKLTEYFVVLSQWFYSPSDACIVVALMTFKNRDFYSTPSFREWKTTRRKWSSFSSCLWATWFREWSCLELHLTCSPVQPSALWPGSHYSLTPSVTPLSPPRHLVREARRVVQSSGWEWGWRGFGSQVNHSKVQVPHCLTSLSLGFISCQVGIKRSKVWNHCFEWEVCTVLYGVSSTS